MDEDTVFNDMLYYGSYSHTITIYTYLTVSHYANV